LTVGATHTPVHKFPFGQSRTHGVAEEISWLQAKSQKSHLCVARSAGAALCSPSLPKVGRRPSPILLQKHCVCKANFSHFSNFLLSIYTERNLLINQTAERISPSSENGKKCAGSKKFSVESSKEL
jgi:hypothetical protein